MMKLIRYIFKRIRYVDHEEIIKVNRQHRKVKLKPYEWIFGREKCAKECKVSERSIRTRIDQQIRTGYVKKVASSSTSTYTVYILVKEAFMKNTDQQFDQQIDQQFDQQFDHNLYIRDQISRDNEVVVDVRAPPPSGSTPRFIREARLRREQPLWSSRISSLIVNPSRATGPRRKWPAPGSLMKNPVAKIFNILYYMHKGY